tara:strand:+ start:212 stop:1948 length:1737 start_codon:yes stop_codon:yes gene_type:complete
MRLLNLSKYFYILVFFFTLPVSAQDTVDIWGNNENGKINQNIKIEKKNLGKINTNQAETVSLKPKIIESANKLESPKTLYGIYDPGENNLSLHMWSKSDGNEIKNIFKRINKIKLSKSAEDFFISTILTYSFSPTNNLTNEEFLSLKVEWLIENNKDNLLEQFLNKNETSFKDKKKIIQYLVDKNIAKANLNNGCKKIEFISKDIRDSYLEKFKIYCLIFNDKKNDARLLFDILQEQNLSDEFFNDKINFLLGVTEKVENKIKDDNLLNFYLSSITIQNFNYEANNKTNKYIWEYLNAANLVSIDDFEDKAKIKIFELAAKDGTLDKTKIFEIYKKKMFDINTLVNADEIYQSLDGIEARSLIFQKYLLSDKSESQLKYLFLLKEIFKKDNLSNIYTDYLSDKLREFNKSDIPEAYQEVVNKNIITDKNNIKGKIKYDDKIFHRSRVLKQYTEDDTPKAKTQKNLVSVYKKVRKNKNYFFSAKDLALIQSLEKDGFAIPKEIKHNEMAKKYDIPSGLIDLMKNDEIGLLSLKFVEILGEDKIENLDPETIYFLVNILNQSNLIKYRNKVLAAALPFRQ